MSTKLNAKSLLALVMALALLVSVMAPSVLAEDITPGQEQAAYTYVAPTEPMAVDENVITATAHRAASPILGMFGLNAVSGFGMINGSAPTDLATAQKSPAVGIWGSAINDSPDPYYWNYFYNFYAEANGLELSTDVLQNPSRAASPVGADTTLSEEGGTVSISLTTRPEIVVGCASSNSGTDTNGYDAQIATINSRSAGDEYYQEGDESYAPELVSYQTTYIKQMIQSVYRLADSVKNVMNNTGKVTRYADTTEEVDALAQDYEDYVYGLIAYVRKAIDEGSIEEKTVAVVTALNDDGTYTLADTLSTSATSLVRGYEYSMAVSKNLLDEVTYQDQEGTDARGSTTTMHTVTKEQLLQADVIVTINNTNITADAINETLGEDTFDGIVISNTPSALYGMTMNSVENAMGYAYVIGCMYSDTLGLNPVDLCTYFYERFLHVTSTDGLKTVVHNNFANAILPSGIAGDLSDTYSLESVKAIFDEGKEYYLANELKFHTDEDKLIGINEWSCTQIPYTDVTNPNASYYQPVLWAMINDITNGTSATTFGTKDTCTRAQIVTFLWRAAGSPEPETTESPFTDVTNPNASYYKAVLWAVENGITTGTSTTTFSPKRECTRAQAVTFIWRAYNSPEPETTESAFTDVTNPAASYYKAVLWAVENGITTGTSTTTFSPGKSCTRAQIVTFLYRAVQNVGNVPA